MQEERRNCYKQGHSS